jgi:uncharacterized protein YbbK (DUF523 family)
VDGPTIPESQRQAWHRDEAIRLGVSSCLLGAEVRYDGGHKRDRYITEFLGEFFEWIPVCPELEIGLGVPRPPIQVIEGNTAPRLVEPVSGNDLTERMEGFADRRLAEIGNLGLDGFILKSRSPSCGLEDVEIFSEGGMSSRNGVGIFARVLVDRWPELPVVHEDQISNASQRTAFFERVLGRYRKRVAATRGLGGQKVASLEAAHRELLERLRVKG